MVKLLLVNFAFRQSSLSWWPLFFSALLPAAALWLRELSEAFLSLQIFAINFHRLDFIQLYRAESRSDLHTLRMIRLCIYSDPDLSSAVSAASESDTRAENNWRSNFEKFSFKMSRQDIAPEGRLSLDGIFVTRPGPNSWTRIENSYCVMYEWTWQRGRNEWNLQPRHNKFVRSNWKAIYFWSWCRNSLGTSPWEHTWINQSVKRLSFHRISRETRERTFPFHPKRYIKYKYENMPLIFELFMHRRENPLSNEIREWGNPARSGKSLSRPEINLSPDLRIKILICPLCDPE